MLFRILYENIILDSKLLNILHPIKKTNEKKMKKKTVEKNRSENIVFRFYGYYKQP